MRIHRLSTIIPTLTIVTSISGLRQQYAARLASCLPWGRDYDVNLFQPTNIGR